MCRLYTYYHRTEALAIPIFAFFSSFQDIFSSSHDTPTFFAKLVYKLFPSHCFPLILCYDDRNSRYCCLHAKNIIQFL